MDSSDIGKAGVQRNKNVEPNPEHTSYNNWEAVDPSGVRGGPKAGSSAHGGHSAESGSPSFAAQGTARGHKDASGAFSAASGRAPKRGPGMTSPKRGVENWGAR
jgi:hypothetical protein